MALEPRSPCCHAQPNIRGIGFEGKGLGIYVDEAPLPIIAALAVFLTILWLIADFIHGGTMGYLFVVFCIGVGTMAAWLLLTSGICALLAEMQPNPPGGTWVVVLLVCGLICGPIGYHLIQRCTLRQREILSL